MSERRANRDWLRRECSRVCCNTSRAFWGLATVTTTAMAPADWSWGKICCGALSLNQIEKYFTNIDYTIPQRPLPQAPNRKVSQHGA